MSIQSEVSRLETAKSALASAITAKGVTVPAGAKLDAYAPLVEQIQTGGGGGGNLQFQTGEFTLEQSLENPLSGASVRAPDKWYYYFAKINIPFAPKAFIASSNLSLYLTNTFAFVQEGEHAAEFQPQPKNFNDNPFSLSNNLYEYADGVLTVLIAYYYESQPPATQWKYAAIG